MKLNLRNIFYLIAVNCCTDNRSVQRHLNCVVSVMRSPAVLSADGFYNQWDLITSQSQNFIWRIKMGWQRDDHPVSYYKSLRHLLLFFCIMCREELSKKLEKGWKKSLTWVSRCDILNESLRWAAGREPQVVLWKLNNATWIICDSSQMFLKHRLIMNISNRQFLY